MLSIKTSFGSTIYDCAKSALENPDSNVGLYAPGILKILSNMFIDSSCFHILKEWVILKVYHTEMQD